MDTTIELSQLRFSLAETATICSVKQELLWKWIARNRLVPVVPGQKGPGLGHLFSVGQLLGIATVAAIQRIGLTCKPGSERQIIESFATMPEGELKRWVFDYQDMYDQESSAQWKSSTPLVQDHGTPHLPVDRVLATAIVDRLEQAASAIRERLASG
jgi:hypothetical protein